VPCVWSSGLMEGVCSPVPTTFCTQLMSSTSCQACAGTSCCSLAETCVADYACGQIAATCGTTGCVAALQAGDATAQALAACLAANCASTCQ
jgi:hypothetical protein